MDALQQAHAFDRTHVRSLATSIDPVEHGGRVVGEVVVTAPVPQIRDHNAVLLEPAPDLDGGAVATLLDAELGGRGLAHRRLYCTTADADRWQQDLVDRGHERTDTVVLRWPGGTLPGDPGAAIVDADADLAEAAVRALRTADPAAEVADADPFAWLVRAQHVHGVQVLVALDEDQPVGAVRVFRGDGIAQVEELDVHPDMQGRGIGRALVAAALARVPAVPLVVLTAEPDDWPVRWYERLGFVPLGRSSGFVRSAGAGPA